MRASRILFLARTIRWATVDAALRNARAISSVVRPQTSRNQPGPGIHGDAIPRPSLQRRREGIVQRLLGEVEVAQQANEGGEHPARVGAVDGVYHLAGSIRRPFLRQWPVLALLRSVLHDGPHFDGSEPRRGDS